MKKSLIIILLVLFTAVSLFAEEPSAPIKWSVTGELNLAPSVITEKPRPYDNINSIFRYDYEYFHLIADLWLRNDEKYSPGVAYWLGRYFYIKEGGLLLDLDKLTLRAGRFLHRDVIDSPYSLFISSMDLPAVLAEITFNGGPLLYQSRWIGLNTRSLYPEYPDRGANYKLFALQFGDVRFGFQDFVIYFDYYFDEEYFFSPIPTTFGQLFRDEGKPWSQDTNDNIVMGLFFDWRKPSHYLYAQWLVDDISLDFLIPDFLRDEFGGNRQIPQKWAWSIGGYYEFPFGRLGFYHGGATKYTFQAYELSNPYQYTYFPAVEYELEDGPTLPLQPVDNYIGYKYGENNLAFLVNYANEFSGVEFTAAIEYVISGSKSPANPWFEYDDVADTSKKTLLLDDPVLEHTISASATAKYPWRQWEFYGKLRFGGVFNRLELVEDIASEPKIFHPQEGENRLIYELTIGVTYIFQIGKTKE
jgi:hypothetical protein